MSKPLTDGELDELTKPWLGKYAAAEIRELRLVRDQLSQALHVRDSQHNEDLKLKADNARLREGLEWVRYQMQFDKSFERLVKRISATLKEPNDE